MGSLQPLLQYEDRQKCSGAYPHIIFVFLVESGGVIMPELLVIFGSITAMVLGPFVLIFAYLHFRRRAITKLELKKLHNDISLIKADIADIKEQIADFIIKTN
jgi:hypothetical protein